MYELYPLGIIPASIPQVRKPWQHDPKRGQRPILFIHGILHNTSTFTWIKQRLAWAGWRHFHELNLFTTIRSIPSNAVWIKRTVEKLKDRYRVPAVDIVAHSMGGILARYYVQIEGGDGAVGHLVTLGTPHQGTLLSRFSPLPHLRELAPHSDTMKRLNELSPPTHTQAVAISGTMDILMRPPECALWPGVRNIPLKDVGHAGLLFSKRVVQIIVSHLASQIPPRKYVA